MAKIRVLVVDDSFFMRRVISDILNSDPDIEVVGDTSNGIDALPKIDSLHPDVVTLDYEMPHMNGLETLGKIMEKEPHPPVIVVSGYVQEGGALTLQFLHAGAVDFVLKPSGSLSLDMAKVKEMLIEKVKIAAKVDPHKLHQPHEIKPLNRQLKFNASKRLIIVIGASTGGPAALEVLLPQFPEHFPYPIVVAQHLPKEFTGSFAQRLSKACRLKVVEGQDKMTVHPGTIYIAPGGADMEVVGDNSSAPHLVVTDNPQEIEAPSVDKLMRSVAGVYKDGTIGIILTGMGKDGAIGMEEIKQKGGKTIVQDESTSVVFGMGREVVERGLADDIVPLDSIIEKIEDFVK